MDDSGAIGIGTMIVFIAMVIVAAVAAAVLINTAGTLQRKSGETGQETTQEVSGNVFVRDIIGNISDNDGDAQDDPAVEKVEWYVSLAPGAEPVDLQNLILRWEHGSNLSDLKHVDNVNTADDCDTGSPSVDKNFSLQEGHFCVEGILDVGDNNVDVLSEGDRTKLIVTLNATAGEEVDVRESVDALLIPEKGTPVQAGFKTPATFSGKSNISLK